LNRKEIDFNPLEKKNLIGESLNKVFIGKLNKKAVAIKQVSKNDRFKLEPSEIQCLVKANELSENEYQNFIVKFFGCFEDKEHPDYYYLVLEQAECNLKEFLAKNECSRADKKKFLYQITKGVSHLHKKGIIHFDLKEQNILMVRRNDELQACICDFGSSDEVNENGVVLYGEKHVGTSVSQKKSTNSKDFLCTYAWFI
jgi:serine/threonine protein kinase